MSHSIIQLMPSALQCIFHRMPENLVNRLEEIRIRQNRPLEVITPHKASFVSRHGTLVDYPSEAYHPTRDDCVKLLDLLTQHSVYTFEEELRRGFVTVRGGHRVGLAGRTVLEHGKVKHLRDIAGFNIRLARECRDIGKPLLPLLWNTSSGSLHHTLVISPPQHGKTTLIRDMCRLLSCGGWNHSRGVKVGIVDERSEIAACIKGVPSFDVGPRTDVLDGCPKAEGMMMFIRSMSPEVLVVDEIGRSEDAVAIHEALHAGICVVATAHGHGPDDAAKRPVLKKLLDERVFGRYVIILKGATGFRYRVADERGEAVVQSIGIRTGEAHA